MLQTGLRHRVAAEHMNNNRATVIPTEIVVQRPDDSVLSIRSRLSLHLIAQGVSNLFAALLFSEQRMFLVLHAVQVE